MSLHRTGADSHGNVRSSLEDIPREKLCATIEEHLSDARFGVGDLCRLFKRSRVEVTHLSQRLTGTSPGRLIRQMRLDHATFLLRHSTRPVKSLALECGFKTYNSFWRTFRKEYGLTPSEYRIYKAHAHGKWIMPPDPNASITLIRLIRDDALLNGFFGFVLSDLTDRDFTLSDLSNQLSISPSQLCRSLRQKLQVSPMRLIQDIRLLHGVELLDKSELSITEIAYSSGFCDQAHFCRSLKKVFGCTPSDYRKASFNTDFISWLSQSLEIQTEMHMRI